MKNLRHLLLALVAGFALVGCGGGKDPVDPTPGPTPVTEEYRDVTIADETLKSLAAGKKIYVTTVGQAEYSLAKNLVDDSGATVDVENNLLTAAEVEKGGVVVVVIGYTGKGISGNITKAGEQERVKGFKAAAEAKDLDLVTLFLGGKQRRGENTDSFLESLLPVARVALVWDDQSTTNGCNLDGKVAQFAKDTPVYWYADENDMVDSLAYVLK